MMTGSKFNPNPGPLCLKLADLDAFILSWFLVSAKPTLTAEPSREIAVCISKVYRGGVGGGGVGGGFREPSGEPFPQGHVILFGSRFKDGANFWRSVPFNQVQVRYRIIIFQRINVFPVSVMEIKAFFVFKTCFTSQWTALSENLRSDRASSRRVHE